MAGRVPPSHWPNARTKAQHARALGLAAQVLNTRTLPGGRPPRERWTPETKDLLDDNAPQHPRMRRAVEVVGPRRIKGDRGRATTARDVARIPRAIGGRRGVDHRAVVLPRQGGANRNLDHLWREVVLVGVHGPVERDAAVHGRLRRSDVLAQLDGRGAEVDLALQSGRRLHL